MNAHSLNIRLIYVKELHLILDGNYLTLIFLHF